MSGEAAPLRGLRVLVTVLDKIFEKIDEDTIIPAVTDYSYDITR